MCDLLPVTDPMLMQYVASCWVTRCVIAQGLYNYPVAHTYHMSYLLPIESGVKKRAKEAGRPSAN